MSLKFRMKRSRRPAEDSVASRLPARSTARPWGARRPAARSTARPAVSSASRPPLTTGVTTKTRPSGPAAMSSTIGSPWIRKVREPSGATLTAAFPNSSATSTEPSGRGQAPTGRVKPPTVRVM